jgi:hypothetical protein
VAWRRRSSVWSRSAKRFSLGSGDAQRRTGAFPSGRARTVGGGGEKRICRGSERDPLLRCRRTRMTLLKTFVQRLLLSFCTTMEFGFERGRSGGNVWARSRRNALAGFWNSIDRHYWLSWLLFGSHSLAGRGEACQWRVEAEVYISKAGDRDQGA